MSKYIKKVNWPWVEVYNGYKEGSIATINMEDISAIWPWTNSFDDHYGIMFKNGNWIGHFSTEALKELQDLLMKETSEDGDLNSAANGLKWLNDLFTDNEESQSVLDWLKENGQA